MLNKVVDLCKFIKLEILRVRNGGVFSCREGKKKREEFLCLVCNRKENEKKMFLFLLLCPYKCERCIKIIDKYVISYYIILFMWILVF